MTVAIRLKLVCPALLIGMLVVFAGLLGASDVGC